MQVFTCASLFTTFLNFIYENKKIYLKKCKRILQKDGFVYTDEEVSQIRDFLYKMAHALARVFPSENYFVGLWPDYAELNLKLKPEFITKTIFLPY